MNESMERKSINPRLTESAWTVYMNGTNAANRPYLNFGSEVFFPVFCVLAAALLAHPTGGKETLAMSTLSTLDQLCSYKCTGGCRILVTPSALNVLEC